MTQAKLFLVILLFIGIPLIAGVYYLYGQFQSPSVKKNSRDSEITVGESVTLYRNSEIRIKNSPLTFSITTMEQLPENYISFTYKKNGIAVHSNAHIYHITVDASDYQTYARVTLHLLFDECLAQDSKKVCAPLVRKQLHNEGDCETAMGVFNVSYCKEVMKQ